MPTIRHSEGIVRLLALRVRVGHGQLVCLLRPQSSATRSNDACLLAFIASPHAPFLRRLRLYRQQHPLPPTGTPKAA